MKHRVVAIVTSIICCCVAGCAISGRSSQDAVMTSMQGVSVWLPPSEAYAHYMMGLMCENNNDPEGALTEYHKVLEIDAESVPTYVRVGANLMRLGRFDEARGFLEKAIAGDTYDARPHFLLAMIHTIGFDFPAAEAEYRLILDNDPADRLALNSLVDLYLQQEQFAQARDTYLAIVEHCGNSASLQFNLGVVSSRLNTIDEAMHYFTQAINLDADYLPAYVALALIHEYAGDINAAISYFETALYLDPLNFKLYTHVAHLCQQTGDFDTAKRRYEFVLSMEPNNREALLGLAYIYLNSNELQEARAIFNQVIEIEPDNARAYFYLGSIYERMGNRATAETLLQQAIHIDPRDPDPMNYLGYMFAEKGERLPEALDLVNRALAIEPDNGAFLDSLGWVYFQMGRFEEARQEIERALKKLDDDDPIVRDHLGDIYNKLNRPIDAETQWQRAWELDPQLSGITEKLKIKSAQ